MVVDVSICARESDVVVGEEQEEEEGSFALTYSLHVRREHTNCCKNWRDHCDEWYWMGVCVEEKPT